MYMGAASNDIPDADLDELRAAAESFMSDTLTIYQETVVDDDQGGETTTRTQRGDVVRCSYRALSGQERERMSQVAAEADLLVKTAALTPVSPDDHLVVVNGRTGEQIEAEVQFVYKRSTEVVRNILCKALDAGATL